MRALLLITLAIAPPLTAHAQAITYTAAPELPADSLVRHRYYATDIGAGFGNVLDTYLSPFSYTGVNLRVQHEYSRWTKRFMQDGQARVSYHTRLTLDGNILENPAGGRNEYAGGLRYTTAWRYHLTPLLHGRLHLAVGPQLSAYGGCVYNEHDGNNPAQAKADIGIDVSATAAYRLNILRRACLLTYTIDIPLIAAAFSPQYGQSYYEIFTLGDYDHNAVLLTPFNAPSLRHQLSLHLPLNRRSTTALRITYASDIVQARTNNLRYHSYAHTLMIGISKTLFHL